MSTRMSEFHNIIILAIWLLIATTLKAQQPQHSTFILDTTGEPVELDEEYFIRPAITGNGGRSTLINFNGSCPLHVGLENTDLPHGLIVRLSPFAAHHDFDDVGVNRDLRIAFDAASSCVQSTEWSLGEKDPRSGRRFIITGRDNGPGSYGNFFRVVETQTSGVYNIQWCPTEVCPTCKFPCGTVGVLRENGKIVLALDAGALPVVFQKE